MRKELTTVNAALYIACDLRRRFQQENLDGETAKYGAIVSPRLSLITAHTDRTSTHVDVRKSTRVDARSLHEL
jgi:hypothetical protein